MAAADSLGHLSALRLAALADDAPAAPEQDHLDACAICRAERAAHQTLLQGVRAERARLAQPLTDWSSLSSALRSEGLITADEVQHDEGAAPVVHSIAAARGRRSWMWATRIAAGMLLAVGGAIGGRWSAGASPLPGIGASGTAASVALARPTTAEEALGILARAEAEYRDATAFLAQQAAPGGDASQPEIYQRRLAVMDEVAALTRAALYDAPHDPVLNQYYLASLGAREATLQQLGSALPAGAQINRF